MASDDKSSKRRTGHGASAPVSPAQRLDTESKPQEFFRDVVVNAIENRGLEATQASESYIVSLLAEHALKPEACLELSEPFGLRLAHAMNASGGERFNKLRALGDDVLFASGFFAEHLERRGVELGYATGLGQVAYGGVASMIRHGSSAEPPVFDELADNFPTFVSLLRHVSDTFAATVPRNDGEILALYQRWSKSGSTVLAEALLGLGVLPTRGSGGVN